MDPKRKTSLQNKPSEPVPTPTNKADTTNKTLAKPPLKKGSSANQVKPTTSQNSSTVSNKSVKSSTDKNEHVNKASLTRVPSKGTLKKDESPKTNIPDSFLKENKPNLDKNEDNIKDLLSVFSTFGQHISTSYNSNIEASHEFDENFKELFEKIEKFINEAVIPTIPSKADQFTSVLRSLDNVFERLMTERSTFQSPITRINDSTQSPLTIHGEEKILCEAEINGFTPETEQHDMISQKEGKIIEQEHKESWKDSAEFLALKQSLIEATSFQAGYKNIQESLTENYKKAVEQLESYKKEFPEIDMFKSVRNIECNQDMGVFISKISRLQSDSEALRQNIAPKDLTNLEESLAYVSDVCQDIRGVLEKEMFYKQSLNLSENKYFNYKVAKTLEVHTSEEDQTKKVNLVKENDQLKEQLLSLLDKLSKNSQDFLNMQPSSDDLNKFKSVQRVMKDSALLRMILNLDIRKQEKVKEKGSVEKSGGEKKSFQLDEPPSCKKNLRFAEMSSIKKRQETQSPFDLDYDTLKKEVEKAKKENVLLVEQKSLLVQKVSETQIIRERLEQINTRLELQAGNLQQQNKVLKDKLKLVSEQAQEGEEGYKTLQEQVITLKEAEKGYQAKIETLEQNLNEVTLTLNQLLAERENNKGKESENIIFEEPKESPEKEIITAEPQKNTFETILENINLVPISKLCKKEGSEQNATHPSQTKERVIEEKIKSPSLDSGAKNICNTASALGKFFGGSEGYEFEGDRLESPPKVSEEDHILLDTKLGEWRDQLKEYLQTQVLCNDKNIPALSVENIKQTVIQQVMKFIDQNLNKKTETYPEEEQEKSPRLKLVDRFDQEIEQTEQIADVFAEILSIRNKLRKAKEIKFILSKIKENGNSFEEDIIIKLEDQLEEILKSLDQSDLYKETEYTKLIDYIEGEKMDVIERLFTANEKNEQLSKQIDALNSKINHFSSNFKQLKEQLVQTNQQTTTYISTEFSSDFVYRILHILTDQLLFAKEVLKLVDTNKKLSLRNSIEEVKAEILSYNRDVKLHYREHKSKQGKEEPLMQLKFISGLFNFYERNYGKIKKMQSTLVENMKIEA